MAWWNNSTIRRGRSEVGTDDSRGSVHQEVQCVKREAGLGRPPRHYERIVRWNGWCVQGTWGKTGTVYNAELFKGTPESTLMGEAEEYILDCERSKSVLYSWVTKKCVAERNKTDTAIKVKPLDPLVISGHLYERLHEVDCPTIWEGCL